MRPRAEPLPAAVAAALAPLPAATRATYASAWRGWARWAARHERAAALAPDAAAPEVAAALAAYFASGMPGAPVATVAARYSALARILGGATDDPAVAAAVAGARAGGEARAGGGVREHARALTADQLRAIVGSLSEESLVGQRDRAMLLLGFTAALRGDELVGLDVRDLRAGEGGRLRVVVGGAAVDVLPASDPRMDPARAVRAWLVASDIVEGPVFRRVDRNGKAGAHALTPQVVGLVVRRMVEAIGLDPAGYGAGSLRAGYVRLAVARGLPLREILATARFRSAASLGRALLVEA